jgi:hypothetical protein
MDLRRALRESRARFPRPILTFFCTSDVISHDLMTGLASHENALAVPAVSS